MGNEVVFQLRTLFVPDEPRVDAGVVRQLWKCEALPDVGRWNLGRSLMVFTYEKGEKRLGKETCLIGFQLHHTMINGRWFYGAASRIPTDR